MSDLKYFSSSDISS